MSSGGVTIGHYIMRKWACFCDDRTDTRDPLAVAMSGVRLGERVLQMGVDDARLVGQHCGKDRPQRRRDVCRGRRRAGGRARRAGRTAPACCIESSVAARRPMPTSRRHVRRGRHPQRVRDARVARTGLRGGRCCARRARVLRAGGRVMAIEAGDDDGPGRRCCAPVPASSRLTTGRRCAGRPGAGRVRAGSHPGRPGGLAVHRGAKVRPGNAR